MRTKQSIHLRNFLVRVALTGDGNLEPEFVQPAQALQGPPKISRPPAGIVPFWIGVIDADSEFQ